MAKSDFPVLLNNPNAILPLLAVGTVLHIGGNWGDIRAGQTALASDGSRFVWSADSLTVVYYQKGKFYGQSARGFIGEITTAPLVEAGRRAAFMARVAEVEMKFLMGVGAGTGWALFAAVIGTEIAEFVVENRENFATWNAQLDTVLRVRASLKTYAPTLYDKVFTATLNQLYKDTKARIPDAVTPDIVAFGVGVVFGAVGKKLAQGKFSILALVFAVIEQLVVRFSISIVPGALKLVAEDYRKLADEIIKKGRDVGVDIKDADVRKIVEEVSKHPEQIKQAFKALNEVFGKAPAKN